MARRAYVFHDDDLPPDPPAPTRVAIPTRSLEARIPISAEVVTSSRSLDLATMQQALKDAYTTVMAKEFNRPFSAPPVGILAGVSSDEQAGTYWGIDRSTVPAFRPTVPVRNRQSFTPERAAELKAMGAWDDDWHVIAEARPEIVGVDYSEMTEERLDQVERAIRNTDQAQQRLQRDRDQQRRLRALTKIRTPPKRKPFIPRF